MGDPKGNEATELRKWRRGLGVWGRAGVIHRKVLVEQMLTCHVDKSFNVKKLALVIALFLIQASFLISLGS